MGSKMREFFRIVNEIIPQNEKIIVFSAFKIALQRCADMATSLLKKSLLKERILYFVSGEDSPMKRKDIFDAFQRERSGGAVCFVVTTVGGLGLNLTKCHYGILLEPCYNPQVERQAMDRMWRIGQIHPVKIFRLVTKNSIEERIVAMQKRKLKTAEQV